MSRVSLLSIVVVTTIAALAAPGAGCGGGRAPMAARPSRVEPPRPEPWPVVSDNPRSRIEVLDREIAARAATLDLPASALEPGAEPMTNPPTCERSPRPACQDICSLSDSICTAADEICQLADELPGDVWASQRCAAGRTTCAAARERCCRC